VPEAGPISLVIPLRDEERSVVALLNSIARQRRLPDEVVAVDAGSRDRTAALLSAWSGPTKLKVISGPPMYPGEARNRGVAESMHAWIAFTDGGIRLDESWLEELARASAAGADVVLGSVVPDCDTWFEQVGAIAYVSGLDSQGARGPFVASMLIRRRAFDAAGGFPPYRAAEDLVFIEKLYAAGLRIVHAPAAVVHWQVARGVRATFRRFALYSEHNLRAGRGRYWHLGVARLYAMLITGALVLAAVGAIAWVPALLPAFWLARAFKAALLKRGSFPFSTLHPLRIIGAAGVLVVLDLATAVGAVRWLARPADDGKR
jgi:glycosyltransferase involved in cell wall biosynthesis